MSDKGYIGRFAPSPTGPLHFGSLVTALCGYLQSRASRGQWLLRIDDIDPPRHQAGATHSILRTLQECQLHWTGKVHYQSVRLGAYRQAVDDLLRRGLAYYCTCSRREIGERPYPGTCRGRVQRPAGQHTVRVQITEPDVELQDLLQGTLRWNLLSQGGDFVVWRVEDLPAYHLATVLDDAAHGVTEIVRGADLLESAPRQRFLQALLRLPSPDYLHIPVAVDHEGRKLSKQNRAPSLEGLPVVNLLRAALSWLGQEPLDSPKSPGAMLEWAVLHWDRSRLPRGQARSAPPISAL